MAIVYGSEFCDIQILIFHNLIGWLDIALVWSVSSKQHSEFHDIQIDRQTYILKALFGLRVLRLACSKLGLYCSVSYK
jgi:hypothetical protein